MVSSRKFTSEETSNLRPAFLPTSSMRCSSRLWTRMAYLATWKSILLYLQLSLFLFYSESCLVICCTADSSCFLASIWSPKRMSSKTRVTLWKHSFLYDTSCYWWVSSLFIAVSFTTISDPYNSTFSAAVIKLEMRYPTIPFKRTMTVCIRSVLIPFGTDPPMNSPLWILSRWNWPSFWVLLRWSSVSSWKVSTRFISSRNSISSSSSFRNCFSWPSCSATWS